MYKELLEGYYADVEPSYFSEHSDLVIVAGITFYSLCEHHLLPFFGKVHIAYLPAEKNGKKLVIGVSKIVRAVMKYSRRLQIQERLTEQIADEVSKLTGSEDVMVVVEGKHMCMVMRGVKNSSSVMVTSAVRGKFRSELRFEVLNLISPYRGIV